MNEETLDEFATRIARDKTGEEKQSAEWIATKAATIAHVAMVICHYTNGGSSFNLCCQGEPRCREAAEAAALVYFGGRDR